MGSERRASENVQRVGRKALSFFRKEGAVSLKELALRTRTSDPTVKRALQWLRDQGADIRYVPSIRGWRLHDAEFALPLSEPTAADLLPPLIAMGLLAELGLNEAAGRARALFNELAGRVPGARGSQLRISALRVTQTTNVTLRTDHVLRLLRAVRRSVVRVKSVSPWKTVGTEHDLEPWQVWIHDGVPYVRGFSRKRGAARTFALANLESVDILPGERPGVRLPDDPWAGDDPRFGIDGDRPGTAIVRLRGPVARWVASLKWHPKQTDTWILSGELLERRIDYRSCREIARRIVSLGDGLVSVEPDELREEVMALAGKATSACANVPRD